MRIHPIQGKFHSGITFNISMVQTDGRNGRISFVHPNLKPCIRLHNIKKLIGPHDCLLINLHIEVCTQRALDRIRIARFAFTPVCA